MAPGPFVEPLARLRVQALKLRLALSDGPGGEGKDNREERNQGSAATTAATAAPSAHHCSGKHNASTRKSGIRSSHVIEISHAG